MFLVCPEGAEAEMKLHWREGGTEGWRIYTRAAHQSHPPTSPLRVLLQGTFHSQNPLLYNFLTFTQCVD